MDRAAWPWILLALAVACAAFFVHPPFVAAGACAAAVGFAALWVASRRAPRVGDDTLRRSEERYRKLVDGILRSAVDGILTIDERGTIEMVNEAALRLFQYREDEVVGKNVKMLMPPPHHELHDGYLRHYLETGERRIIGIGREVEGRRKDGTHFPLDLAVSEVVLEGRRVFAGFIRDITARKKAAEELRQERDFAESLIETAQAIVLVLDPNGRIVRFNPYMERLSGYRLEDVVGKDWFATFAPRRDAGRTRQVFGRTLEDREARGNINPIVTKDGQEREIAWWAKTLRDAEGRAAGVLSVGQDVTELRAAQEKLLQSERLAGIGQMITGLAHESRNALQRMQACLEMLEMEIGDRPQALDYAKRIQAAQEYLGQLYEEVRSYARPIQLERRTCDLRRLWGAAWTDLALRREGRSIELEDQTEGLDLHCDVDPFAFGQVFRNLFENAIAACGDEGRIAILARAAEYDGTPAVVLVVNDDGPGFPPGHEGRIFQPFFTTKTQGTGLGLAIVRRIVDAHGGRAALTKGPLPGVALELTVPRGASPGQPVEPSAKSGAPPA
ncbi:MAG TPA: PAS domain S-box protein [Planctomycetota bacterium]|nr:PAS domain S-box protein [Planctomycetota bacterium]